ncbi:hypothetical protein V0U79_05360 [Hyphobacterium sp. HN65]|uniref:Ribbon-helix-helix protein CopG domain-containing protein n=1 Tax=Hyphobacterium lacteum TaxID=3116575 RepID=A0ABU7LPE9_9PROT|nr:hypothetical protein [Hyphobacterium sp. HN65]MEE2525786.1 hypothetical protein [Hyphobacterium sp. HN65]
MTSPSYAPLHSGLLVRKGAAAPSPAGTRTPHDVPFDPFSIARRDASDADTAPPPQPHPGPCDAHHVAAEIDDDDGFSLTDRQDRRLRLAAAKLDTTRGQLLSEAVDNLLTHLGETELSACSCYRALGADG